MRRVDRVGPWVVPVVAGALLTLFSAGAAVGEAEGTAPTEVPGGREEPPPDAQRLGDEACLECHDSFAADWRSERHNQYLRSATTPEDKRGCEGCHGPGSAHLEDPAFKSINNPNRSSGLKAVEMCLACHGTDVRATDWLASGHAQAQMHCGSCHEVHHRPGAPGLLKQNSTAQCLSCHRQIEPELRLNSHHPVLEGRVDCIDCHDPHAGEREQGALLKTAQDRCLRCHMEKRGPFVFEHATEVAEGDANCTTCHRSHGSPNPKLLQYYGRGACLQCHVDIAADPAHRTRPQDCSSAGCHHRIHGSNTNRLFLN